MTKKRINLMAIAITLLAICYSNVNAQISFEESSNNVKNSFSSFAKSAKVFDRNKESFKRCYSFLSKYSNYDNERAYSKANEAQNNLREAKTTMSNLERGIPEGFNKFENNNQEARSLSFASKAIYIKKYMVKTKEKLQAAKKNEISKVRARAGWIERTNDMTKAEEYYSDMTVRIAKLDELFPGDLEVRTLKNTSYARAKKMISGKATANNTAVTGYKMPKENYVSMDISNVKRQISALFRAKFSTSPIKISIPDANWTTRYETVIQNGRQIRNAYEVIKAFIAYPEAGIYYVHEINFRRDNQSIDFYSFVGRKEIRKENI